MLVDRGSWRLSGGLRSMFGENLTPPVCRSTVIRHETPQSGEFKALAHADRLA